MYSVAAVRIKEGKLEEFLEMFRKLVPMIRQEKGCHQYVFTTDMEGTGISAQKLEKNVVTFIEKWESVDALEAHMMTPHMKAQVAKEKDFVDELVSLKILKEG
jgi:quinol monooxygenase YgiN